MKIGLFNESFPPVMDGVSICVSNYARCLQKKVGGVAVITPNVWGAEYDKYDFEVMDYFSVPVPFRKPYVTGIAEIDPFFLTQIIKSRFEIVHAHSPFGSGQAALNYKKMTGVPMVATFHSKYRDDFEAVVKEKKLVDFGIKRIVEFYEAADQVWVPQETVVDTLREYGFKGPVEVMPNGSDLCANYDEDFFIGERKNLGIAADDFVMLYVGQHVWQKNLRFLLEALNEVRDLNFKMFFVGNGYAANEMKEIVRQKNLGDKVSFVGTVRDREKLSAYYAAADLFLFPSLYDTDGIVVKEAAALHTPSLMLREASASAIITDGVDGFLAPNDIGAYAKLIRDLAHDRNRVKEAGQRASRSLVRSWEDIADEVLDRYNALLKSKGLPKIQRIDND